MVRNQEQKYAMMVTPTITMVEVQTDYQLIKVGCDQEDQKVHLTHDNIEIILEAGTKMMQTIQLNV